MRESGEDKQQRLYQLSYWRALNNRKLKNIQQEDEKKREKKRANLAFKSPDHLHKYSLCQPFTNSWHNFLKNKTNLCVSCQTAFQFYILL